MKLQKTTVALMAIALLLGAAVLVAETRRGPEAPETAGESDRSPVFEVEEAAVTGLHIETAGQAVTFARDEQGFWQMIAPETAPAEEAAIAFLLNSLTTDGLTRTLTMDGSEQTDFGLEVPFATVRLTLADGSEHQLILGNPDFSGQGIYGLIDPDPFPVPDEATAVSVALLSQDILNGVDRPLSEWQGVADVPPGSAPGDIPSQDAPPVDTPAEGLPLPPAPEVPGEVPPESGE